MKLTNKLNFKDALKIAGAITLGSYTMGHAGDLKEDIQAIRSKVRDNYTQRYTIGTALRDTVFVYNSKLYDGGDMEIHAGLDFTAFYLEGDDGRYAFDIGNDGVDRVIFTEGRIDDRTIEGRANRAHLELEGLSATHYNLGVELDLNNIVQEMEGRTPYNTRTTYLANPDSSATTYDFGNGSIEEMDGPEGARELGRFYRSIVDITKIKLGIN